MILPGVTLEQVDEIYQRMGVKELVVIPWFEGETLAGIITGAIEKDFAGYPGLSAFLEYFIVLPEAQQKLRAMQQLPHLAASLVRELDVERIILCIADSDPRADRLDVWARRCGYVKYGYTEDRSWYVHHLQGETHGQAQDEAPDPGAASGAPASAASGT